MNIKPKTDGVIRRIVDKLAGEYKPKRIILFGSYAYGTPNEDSDIDLLIIKDIPERFIKRSATVRRILTDPKRRIGLEIIVLTPDELSSRLAIGNQFIEQILEKGRVLYAA